MTAVDGITSIVGLFLRVPETLVHLQQGVVGQNIAGAEAADCVVVEFTRSPDVQGIVHGWVRIHIPSKRHILPTHAEGEIGQDIARQHPKPERPP